MKTRAYTNLVLIFIITIVAFFAVFRTAFAGSKTFLFSWGSASGYTNPISGAHRSKSQSSVTLYWLQVNMNGWGASSPDMGCSWKIKDNHFSNGTFSTTTGEVAQATSWVNISKHSFQLVLGGTVGTGYTSSDPGNAYGKANCWSNFTPNC